LENKSSWLGNSRNTNPGSEGGRLKDSINDYTEVETILTDRKSDQLSVSESGQ
jgi:hypothetical protein